MTEIEEKLLKALDIVQRDFETTSPGDDNYEKVVRSYDTVTKLYLGWKKQETDDTEAQAKLQDVTTSLLLKEKELDLKSRELDIKDRELDLKWEEAQVKGNQLQDESSLKWEELELKKQQMLLEQNKFDRHTRDILESVGLASIPVLIQYACNKSYLDHVYTQSETRVITKAMEGARKEVSKFSDINNSIRNLFKF